MGLKQTYRFWAGWVIGISALAAQPYVYTATERYVPDAWACGGERFPQGAAIQAVSASGARELARGFFASADPEVSFDGQRVLFSGKARRGDPWQIWEVSANGGEPHRIAGWPEDSIRPLYLPGDKIVYARRMAGEFQLEVLELAGGKPSRITFAPGNILTCDVLHDGRVLYESNHELYTVYPDGSGVEAYRCDHGPSRHGARQMASRDVVFDTGAGLARFTSAMATQINVRTARGGEFAGPVAEFGPEAWLVSFRPSARLPFQIYKMDPARGLQDQAGSAVGVQPAALAAREVPLRFPSGLHDWEGANVLCLNAYTSKSSIVDGSIDSVRLYSAGAAEQPILLGETRVESDGSFFLYVPSERPLRMELRDRSGRTIVAEHGWFWMRRGEQRVCVGCHAGPERAPENAAPKVLLRRNVPVRMTGESR